MPSPKLKRFDGSDGHLVPGTQLIHEWVHSLKSEGWDIVDTSRGKPSFPAHQDALNAMRQSLGKDDTHTITYGTHALGEPDYKVQVADALSKQYKLEIAADCIAFTPGAQLGLYITFLLMHARRPDGVFVSTMPGYLNYAELIRLATGQDGNAAMLPIALEKARQFQFTPADLKRSLAANNQPIAGFVFCNPVNPTGQVITHAQWLEFADILRHYDAPILMDEAFAEVIFEGASDYSLLHAAPDLLARIILFRSGTKAIGMSGERLSCTVIAEPYLKDFLHYQSRILANSPISGQAGMAAGLRSMTPENIQAISGYYAQNAQSLMQTLHSSIGEPSVITPKGGFYLLADFSKLIGQALPSLVAQRFGLNADRIATDEHITAYLLAGAGAADKQGVAVIPGSYFGLDPQDGIVRISYSITRGWLAEACSRLTNYLR